ncbi:MAG: hypothetical protein QXQ24_07420 [Nitrososphaeria archaeon]
MKVKNIYTKILIALLIYIIMAEVLIYYQPLQEDISFFKIDSFSISENSYSKIKIKLNVTINLPIDSKLQVVFLPLKNQPVDLPIFIYYDKTYPSATSEMSIQGLIDHLVAILKLNSYKGSITLVNASELSYIMQQFNKSVIIIPTGVLPETVHNKTNSLVGKWLKSGGIMFWVGEGFLVYSGKKSKTLDWFSPETPGWESHEKEIGFQLVYGSPSIQNWLANVTSPFSEALDIQYSSVKFGAFVNSVYLHNGYVLGKIGGDNFDRASVVAVPIGLGWLIYFGGDIGVTRSHTGEDIIARDIAHIIFSCFINSEKSEIEYLILSTKIKESLKEEIQLEINNSSDIIGIQLFVFNKNLFYPIIYRTFIKVK